MRDLFIKRSTFVTSLLTFIMLIVIYTSSNAMPLNIFKDPGNGWTEFANDDGVYWYSGYYQKVGPGYGGQNFDAEHLFYKLQGNILSIGLQTGFDLSDGHLRDGSIDYYAGDLALSFDGNISNGYEYAADFGLLTKDYVNFDKVGGNTKTAGYDSAGLYRVTAWNNDVYGDFGASKPFAMQSGSWVGPTVNSYDSSYSGDSTVYHYVKYGGNSYYRTVSFPVSLITAEITGNIIKLSAHWTMSCGNDAINGSATIQRTDVPEPGTMFLFGSLAAGLFGFKGLRKRFMK